MPGGRQALAPRRHSGLPPVMRTRTALVLPVLSLLAAACGTTPIDRGEAEAMLSAQAACWNRGDLPGFVASYWDGAALTFLGGSGVTRGRADLLARYQQRYPTAEARGTLRFAVVDFQPLGGAHALLLGRYELERQDPSSGWFSLVLARQQGHIVILHDHTSESPRN